MTPRERILAAIEFTGPDRCPIHHYAFPGAIWRHGQRLLDLADKYPDDFGNEHIQSNTIPPPEGNEDAEDVVEWQDARGGVWRRVLVPIARRYQDSSLRKYLRADGAFACPEVYQYLEQEGFQYAIRLPANPVLQRQIEPLVTRPAGWGQGQTIVQYYDLSYQAVSWQRPRRVIAKVQWHRTRLLPEASFVVTNLGATPQTVVEFYNHRGTAEQWIKEGKYALHWTRLSCHRFVANQVRLALFVLAYNLGNFLRRLVLPESVRHWSLRSIQVKLIKIGAKVVHHARQVIFQMAEIAVPKELFEQILERIWALAPGSG